jgi:hypothetical protein
MSSSTLSVSDGSASAASVGACAAGDVRFRRDSARNDDIRMQRA